MLTVPGDAAGRTYASSTAVAPDATLALATPANSTQKAATDVTSPANHVVEFTAVPMINKTLPAIANPKWATSLSGRVPPKLASTRVANPPNAANVAT